jgi:hypothetical protein
LLEVDHIIPEAHGGSTDETNLTLACPLCNSYKSDQIAGVDPETQSTIRLFNPRLDYWREHFEWVDAGSVIRGKTAIGRATVETLKMNHADIVTARRLWIIAGWHPPAD